MTNIHQLNLNETDFFYDMTDGFRMGVEKNWHKLEPVTVSKNVIMHDSELNPLDPTNYAITIHYKLVVPLSEFSDSNVTENDFEYTANTFGFNNANNLGMPFTLLSGKTGQSTALNMQRVTLAYVAPGNLNETSIPNSAFATGTSLQNFLQTDGTKKYSIPKTFSNTKTFLLGSNLSATATSPVQPVKVNVDKANRTVSYTVTTDANCLNVPTDAFNEQTSNNKYLMPLLFHEYGLLINSGSSFTSSGNPKNLYNAWICIALGVKEIS